MRFIGSHDVDDSDPRSEGERIAADVYWRQEHEPHGKHRMDRLAELIDEALTKAASAATVGHLENMIRQAGELDGQMNNSGFYYLGHLVREERERVALAFAAMVMDYAKDHDLPVRGTAP